MCVELRLRRRSPSRPRRRRLCDRGRRNRRGRLRVRRRRDDESSTGRPSSSCVASAQEETATLFCLDVSLLQFHCPLAPTVDTRLRGQRFSHSVGILQEIERRIVLNVVQIAARLTQRLAEMPSCSNFLRTADSRRGWSLFSLTANARIFAQNHSLRFLCNEGSRCDSSATHRQQVPVHVASAQQSLLEVHQTTPQSHGTARQRTSDVFDASCEWAMEPLSEKTNLEQSVSVCPCA